MADSKKYVDLQTAYPFGINSGVSALLLPKDQCSFAINTTFRGGYATDRSPVQKLVLDFGGDTELENAVRKGFFQGAAPNGYRPDSGPTQNIAQINGRLFSFTEDDASWTVAEITVLGDPNDATTSQVWMWQSEKWLIVSDGSGRLPIFYDGVTSRRSTGPSVVLGSVTAVDLPGPNAIGTIVEATMAAVYSGPFDVVVRFNGALYRTSSSASTGYRAILKNINFPAGTMAAADNIPFLIQPPPLANSSSILSVSDVGSAQTEVSTAVNQGGAAIRRNGTPIALSVWSFTNVWFLPNGFQITVTLDNQFLGSVGAQVPIGFAQDEIVDGGAYTYDKMGYPGSLKGIAIWTVTEIQNGGTTLVLSLNNVPVVFGLAGAYIFGVGTFNDNNGNPHTITSASKLYIPLGQVIQSTSTQPVVEVGRLTQDAVAPSPGSTVDIFLDTLYAGIADQPVTYNGFDFELSPAPTPAPSALLYLVNINDSAAIPDPPTALPLDITSIPEIPACRMGAYGQGQNWFSSVDGLSFGMSDLVGSSSGSQAYNYRDAVLKTSDLEITGFFHLPSAGEIITSMTFTAVLDRSLGQGPLQIGLMSGMFSCRAPFTLIDFQGTTLTDAIANPILPKSLIGFGPIAQNSTILANSDTIFRQSEGVGSFIEARRQFSDVGGNTPISREMTRIIDRDIKSLLSYSSAIVFDNRLRMTCAPQVSAQGVFHIGELVLNYDLLSSLRGKAQPVWDGFWSGLNTLQYVQGLFGPVSRAFAFTFNLTDSQIELYELLPTGTEHFDNGDVRIIWVVETPVLFNALVKNLTDLARLMDGEIYLSDINGRVDVTVKYRPVFHPCWIDWHTFQVCSDMSASNGKEQVVYPLGLGEPTARNCDEINNRPFREAVGFQLRFEFTGHCKLWGVKALGEPIPTPDFAKPAGNCDGTPVVCKALNCDVPDDYRVFSLDGLLPLPVPVPDEPILPFANDEVYYEVDACGAGTTLTVVPPSLQPGWILTDNSNSRVVGLAGTFRAATKAAANAEAQSQLDAFVVAALADGSLVCAATLLSLFYDTFESYTNGVAVNGLGEGNWTNLPSPYVAD